MKSINRPRNREKRTKPMPADAIMSVKIQVPRDAYLQLKELEQSKRYSKEEIFLCGLQTCAGQ